MQGFRHTIVTSRNGKCKFGICREVETACGTAGKRSACLSFEDPMHLIRPAYLAERQLKLVGKYTPQKQKGLQHYELFNFHEEHSGLGVGRLLRTYMAVTDNKVSHVFKTLGMEFKCAPLCLEMYSLGTKGAWVTPSSCVPLLRL